MTSSEFKLLILPLKNRMYRFAMSLLSQNADAEDVVQDVMIKCWEEIDDPKKIKNIEAFSMKMIRNKSLDKLKRKGRNYLQIVDQYELNTNGSDPFEVTRQREAMSRIRDIMELLPEKQRSVIALRDIEGYTYNDISETLNMDLNQVKINLHRARTYIREQMIKFENYGISKT